MSTRTLIGIVAAAASAASLFACSSNTKDVPVIGAVSSMGQPSIVMKNTTTVPLEVSVWMTERLDDYEATWEDMKGRTETIEVKQSRRFLIPEYEDSLRPLVRIEVETRGPSFEDSHHYWFESLSSPGYTVVASGTPDDLALDAKRAVIVRVPEDRIRKPRRLQERPGQNTQSAGADSGG